MKVASSPSRTRHDCLAVSDAGASVRLSAHRHLIRVELRKGSGPDAWQHEAELSVAELLFLLCRPVPK